MNGLDFEQLYLMAIMNSKKPKNVLNWVHVSRHGPGSTKAHQICKHFGIDPEGTDFRKAESKEGEMTEVAIDQEIDEAIAKGESFYKIRKRFEKAILERALIKTRGSQTEAAKMLGISRTGLGGILKRVGR